MASYDTPLQPVCKVLARKFGVATVDAVAQLVSNCSLGLGLLPDTDLECVESAR